MLLIYDLFETYSNKLEKIQLVISAIFLGLTYWAYVQVDFRYPFTSYTGKLVTESCFFSFLLFYC